MYIQPGQDRADKVRQQLDNFFNRSKPAGSFREIYEGITGDSRCSGLLKNCNMQTLRESAGLYFREAVSSTTFTAILGEAVNRALLREYAQATNFADWRAFCDTAIVSNFRAQRRGRLGGYGNLPVVGENAAYDALATPTDEEASYTVSKRGGTETVSLEAIANDDVGLIRRIPVALATAAHRTLYEFAFGFIENNSVIYDTKALFHVDHSNLGSTAFSAATYAAAGVAMRKQTELDSNKPLGLRPRHLIVPPELEEAAFNLFRRDTNNDPAFIASPPPAIHVVSHWTDANNWYVTADPSQLPMMEIGFFGQEEPEVFVAEDPAGGSMFSNDQVKFKIRHTYAGAVLDYRGFYGAIVA